VKGYLVSRFRSFANARATLSCERSGSPPRYLGHNSAADPGEMRAPTMIPAAQIRIARAHRTAVRGTGSASAASANAATAAPRQLQIFAEVGAPPVVDIERG